MQGYIRGNGRERSLPPEVEELAHSVIGAALEVHRVLGPGYIEVVYEQALCVELELRAISFVRQPVIQVGYKGKVVGEGRLDLLVGDSLVVELKAVDALTQVHSAQVVSYLKATRRPLGLLINFNVPLLKAGGIKRVIASNNNT
jgi:GxxExxY protein